MCSTLQYPINFPSVVQSASIQIINTHFLRSRTMRYSILLISIFLEAFILEYKAQAVLMLRSDTEINCSITKLGDVIVMKAPHIATIMLNSEYKPVNLQQGGFFFINSKDASTGIRIENNDTLWADWIGKEERAAIRNGFSRELNHAMAAVDSLCDTRLLELLKFSPIRRTKEVRYFTDTLRKKYQNHVSTDLKHYVFYRTAYVEIIAESDSRARLTQKYFEKDAEPDNLAWIESFRNLYSGFILQKLNGRNGIKLQNALREKAWKPLWTEFRNDTLAMHPEVREFAFLLGISQLRNQNGFRDISFEWMLDSLMDKSIYPHVKQSITSMKSDWLKYAKGREVPDFGFKLLSGKAMRLSDLKGKPVYLCFYATFSQSTLRELAMLQAFKERFKNEIEILVVIKTSEKTGLSRALESIKSTLLVADFASCSDVFSDIPETLDANGYFLINRKGHYYRAPADGPETGVEDSFLGLVKD